MDIANAEVIVRIPQTDGSKIELIGMVKSLEVTTRRNVAPIYDIDMGAPSSFLPVE